MGLRITRRALGAFAVMALAVVPVAVVSWSAPAGAAGPATAGNAAALESAWTDSSTTTITLTANITITGGDCADEGYVRTGGGGITVDGQGTFGIVSQCPFGRILLDDSSETVTLTGLTHFDGGAICDVGGGLAAGGDVNVSNSSFSDNFAAGDSCPCGVSDSAVTCGQSSGLHSADIGWLGGAIYSDSNLVIEDSTFSGNHADYAGGAVFASGDATVTNSTFTENSAGQSGPLEATIAGGAIAANGSISVDGSALTGNWLGDQQGNPCAVCAPVGGAIANGYFGVASAVPIPFDVTITNSTLTDNHADCAFYCYAQGGAVASYWTATITGSTFTGNTTNVTDCGDDESDNTCYNVGGAVSSEIASISGSSFTDNHADASGCINTGCWNEGGAIISPALQLTGSTVTGNSAACDTNCASYGGGIASGTRAGIQPTGASVASWAAGGFRAAVDQPGDVSIVQSNVSDNVASCDDDYCGVSGGGLLAYEPNSLTVDASTFSGNEAQYGGAFAVFSEGAPATVTNSTITGNTSVWDGAIDLEGSDASLAYDTIVGNIVGALPPEGNVNSAASGRWGGVAAAAPPGPEIRPANVSGAQLTVFGTIVALPVGGPNCDIWSDGGITSQGYNWSDDTSCGFTNATDLVATPNDPQLNALGDWGGPTPTMLPVTPKFGGAISPVIDAIPAAACQTGVAAGITTDQRGAARPSMNGCEIGAVEVTLEDYQVEALVVTPKFTG
ncbi:MAG: choice-of-anchor Q domain-containing protein [Acidimicrobiia bacterium]